MRYFRYIKTEDIDNSELEVQYQELLKREKRNTRRNNVRNTLSVVVFFAVSVLSCGGFISWILQIPVPENLFLWMLRFFAVIILVGLAIIISICLGGFASYLVGVNKNKSIQNAKRQILSEACLHLSNYYELQEPCIVTKCYDSSNKRFANHDVCIFVAGDELRITTNLKHGFFHGENDLGCYAFKSDEITVSKLQGDKFLIAELKSNDVDFLFGYRAKSFIEKNFLSIYSSL